MNALIHRSYLRLGCEVQVNIFDDRMEITSPGAKIGDPLPEDVVTARVKSERRNPVIADVFSRMDLMERRGTGLREICTATASEDAYRPEFKPRFDASGEWFTVTLYNMHRTDTDQVTDQVDPRVESLLDALGERELSAQELMAAVGLSHLPSFRQNYLNPALRSGLVERTIPDRPRSRNQRYRKTKQP